MTTTCNHACIFCSESERMRKYAHAPLTELQIKTILVDRAKKGFNYVNFTGWEPTLFPKFLSLLQFTKKLWYTIYVGTNGTMLAGDAFAKEFFNYVDVLSLSIHWYDESSCTEQTWDPSHFSRFTDICKHTSLYKTHKQYYQTNIVLNQYNYKHLEKIIQNIIYTGYPVDHILVSYVAPEWDARSRYSELSVSYEEIIPYLLVGKNLADTTGKNFRIFWVPLCKLPEDLHICSNDFYWKERNTIERYTNNAGKVTLIDIYSPDNSRERVFVDRCDGCSLRNNPCTGVFQKYLDHYEF